MGIFLHTLESKDAEWYIWESYREIDRPKNVRHNPPELLSSDDVKAKGCEAALVIFQAKFNSRMNE